MLVICSNRQQKRLQCDGNYITVSMRSLPAVYLNITVITMEGFFMNKAELIEKIASGADISKAAAGRALDAFLNTVTDELKAGEKVAILGFGTFTAKERAARTGRNPKTGAELQIAASRVAKFTPGKGLKDVL